MSCFLRSALVSVLFGSVHIAAARGAVTIGGRAYDGEASAAAVRDAFRASRAPDDAEKTPLADTELTVDLLVLAPESQEASGKPVRSWTVKTDATGGFRVETGLDAFPDRHGLVATAVKSGTRMYSPFFLPGVEGQAIHLYPSSENPANVTAHLKVVYDLQGEGDAARLRIRASLQVMNAGGNLYVGRPAGSRWREIWRLPVPPGAQLVSQKSPQPGSAGWRLSGDKRWLILDTPIPGVCDYNLQGAWEVQCLAPPRQSLVQTFPVSFQLEPERVSVWCVSQDMDLTSARIGMPPYVDTIPDPFTGEARPFKVLLSGNALKAGEDVRVALTVDNAAIGQVSRKAFLWVGGFVLLALLAVLLGTLLGPREPPPESVLAGTGGGNLLDRIAELDEEFEAGQLAEREYRRLRDPLVALAAEEMGTGSAMSAGEDSGSVRLAGEDSGSVRLAGEDSGSARLAGEDSGRARPSGSAAAGTVGAMGAAGAVGAVALPPQARALLRRIDELDSKGPSDPSSVRERAHLLEALAKTLPRDREGGSSSNAQPE